MDTQYRNISAFEYNNAAAPIINNICEEFFLNFGLTTFVYIRIFNDGRYLLLSNHTDWAKYWFQNIQTIKNTTFQSELQNVPKKEPFYFLWDTASDGKLMHVHNDFGMWHGFDIDFRLEDSVEVWSFSASADREQINSFYLNNFKLFHRICLYFREKSFSYLKINDKNKLAFFKEDIDISFNSSLIKSEEANIFFSNLLPDKYSLKTKNGHTNLSKRELECLIHLSHGKTAKEIGKILHISPRTVESYILSTKDKTGLNNKSELLDLIRNDTLKWM